MTEARDEAEDDEVPGEVCSVRMVVPWAIQALRRELRHLFLITHCNVNLL